MPARNHVCMWTDNGWKPVTAAEAAKCSPIGRVSARGGLFMCSLCQQFVTLTEGAIQTRHFRHRSKEADKSCPERVFGAEAHITFSSNDHDLPIRVCNITGNSFSFEMGLLPVPAEIYAALQDRRVAIKSSAPGSRAHIFLLKEHLRENGITYVPIGTDLAASYHVTLDSNRDELLKYWPGTVRGFEAVGGIFDGVSRKKLPSGSDIQVGKPYYLLWRRRNIPESIDFKEVSRTRINGSLWYLYRVMARSMTENAAEFFLHFRCLLTETPASIEPIWPLYIESLPVLRHNSEQMAFYVRGDKTDLRSYPYARQICDEGEYGIVAHIACISRQQMVSIGRSGMLQYTYLWREPLNQSAVLPQVMVTDVSGKAVFSGVSGQLPRRGMICIYAPFDGVAEIRWNGTLTEIRELKAKTEIELGSIQFGCEIRVLQGLDVVWSVRYDRGIRRADGEESDTMRRLLSASGPLRPIPHSWGAVAHGLQAYPQVRQWLYRRIRIGTIPEQAYLELKRLIGRDTESGG